MCKYHINVIPVLYYLVGTLLIIIIILELCIIFYTWFNLKVHNKQLMNKTTYVVNNNIIVLVFQWNVLYYNMTCIKKLF